jgi:hypothetical protein
MSRRTSLLCTCLGLMSALAGVIAGWHAWAAASPTFASTAEGALGTPASAPGLATEALVSNVGARALLPSHLASEPLIWLGLFLLFTPPLLRRLGASRPRRDPSFAAYDVSRCPECQSLVDFSSRNCPICGAAQPAVRRAVRPSTPSPSPSRGAQW